jgi:hypothetical protein
MKTLLLALLLTSTLLAAAQGTFVYDQQSATDFGVPGGFVPVNPNQPAGQSFTPAMPAIGFVQLQLREVPPSLLLAATMVVRLWGDALEGTLLGVTDPVHLPPDFYGITNFTFASPVSVVPGTTYYLQPVIISGGNDRWSLLVGDYNYSGGVFFNRGVPNTNDRDAWFREGIVVPEPSTRLILILGLACFHYVRSRDVRTA